MMTIFLNSCLCIDLMISFRDPFKPGHKRMTIYVVATVIFAVTITPFTRSYLTRPEDYFMTFVLPLITGISREHVQAILENDTWIKDNFDVAIESMVQIPTLHSTGFIPGMESEQISLIETGKVSKIFNSTIEELD